MPILRQVLEDRVRGKELDRALASGKVRVHGVPLGDGSREVDPASVRYDPSFPRCVPGRDASIVFKGAGFVVVHKPPRMLSVPAPGRREPDVLAFVEKITGRALAVHRLDEETSGLMLVATDPGVQEYLKGLLEEHKVRRQYLAFVEGNWQGRRTISEPIVRDGGDGRRAVGRGGQPAVTHFAFVQALRGATLVEAHLETGRTHQVRVHLSFAGFPVLGDPLYAPLGVTRKSDRLALHATLLDFVDANGKHHEFHAPLPDDLWHLQRRLVGRNS